MVVVRSVAGAIGSYIPSSFIDWEGHVSAVLFLIGCNFRCPFCHNGLIVKGDTDVLSEELVLEHIRSRKPFLDGVVISGGEPTLSPIKLRELLLRFKEMGLPVKLDTNGSNPFALGELLSEGLLNAVAMDVKAPWDKYDLLCGCEVDVSLIKRSIDLLSNCDLTVEFRTTFVPALLDYDDLDAIRGYLDKGTRWVIQCFNPEKAMDEALRKSGRPEREILRERFPDAIIR